MTAAGQRAQIRTLVRADGLAAFRHAIIERALEGPALAARRRIVLVPTRASAEILRQTIEGVVLRREQPAVVLPDLVTRDEWMRRLHRALPSAPPLLTRSAREIILAHAARQVAARSHMAGAPFDLRPALVAELLQFFDELRLRRRSVRRFARVIFDELRVERGTDRGSESLIHQASFMGFTFLGYERGVDASGGVDEHALRRLVLAAQPTLPFDHVIIAVADRSSDRRGLWPADFDLLGRLRGCRRIDVVMTEETHDAGVRERLEEELPGIEEVRQPAVGRRPVLVTPAPASLAEDDVPPCVVSRDREEELRDVARRIRDRARAHPGRLEAKTAIVFQRPLPYLYLSDQVLGDAGVPFQSFDALPLASEPFAALVDLVLAMARTQGAREATVALLRSPLVQFVVDGAVIAGEDAAALEDVLVVRQSTADALNYEAEVERWRASEGPRVEPVVARARRAAAAAATIARRLAPFRTASRASEQVATIAAFIREHERNEPADSPGPTRGRRARAAVLGALDDLTESMARYDDDRCDHELLIAHIHHAIEAHTFAPRQGRAGILLTDAVSARFGAFDHLHLVGLVETDWPERSRRSIFFTSPLLTSLGWPQEPERSKAELAAFHDLVASAGSTVTFHAFQLEGDAIVALSPLVHAVHDLTTEAHAAPSPVLTFADEVLTRSVAVDGLLDPRRAAWLSLRRSRPSLKDLQYCGQVSPQAPIAYRVTGVDQYLQCPFQYFSSAILRLPEERDEVAGLSPRERGTLLHRLLERFYKTWLQDHGGTISIVEMPSALELFSRLTHEALAGLLPADRALETDRLLGSIASPGVADRLLEHEASGGGRIVDRALEHMLEGTFTFPYLSGFGQRPIAIRGKADRIDVFDDGSLRVVDYKLTRVPEPDAVQIAVYAHCVRQQEEGRDHRSHAIREATYLAFGDDRPVRTLGKTPAETESEVNAKADVFARAVGSIEAGDFPPRPRRTEMCQRCPYAGVCRKEYRVEADAAESL